MSDLKEMVAPANKRVFKQYFIPIEAPRGYWQMDLADFSQVAKVKENKNMNFVLVLIEIHSRYVLAFPLKDKRPETVLTALQSWANQTSPKGLLSDNGSEWKGVVKSFLQQRGIEHKILDNEYSKNTAGVVERFIRTLRMKLRDYWLKNDNLVWLPYLNNVVEEYNNTIHSRMRKKPIDVFKGDAPQFDRKKVNISLAIGSKVRTLIPRKTFDKASALPKWSQQVFSVVGKEANRYRLNDGELYPRWALKVTDAEVTTKTKKTIGTQMAEKIKEKKVRQALKKDDINSANIIARTTRRRLRT